MKLKIIQVTMLDILRPMDGCRSVGFEVELDEEENECVSQFVILYHSDIEGSKALS